MKKVALVTGGTRGIGLGIATALAREGYDLALCGLREEGAVAAVLDGLRALGGAVCYTRCDVRRRADREALLADVRARCGALHVLVNNAGMAPRERRDILEATEESFQEVLETNLQGPYFLTQAAARWMIEQKAATPSFAGCVVFITSVSATVASVNRGEYCVGKAGLAMASRLWAVRLGAFGIPVYEVRPGVVATDMTSGVQAKYDRLIAEGLTVEPRWGQPEDVGRVVATLARGDLPYGTGQVVMVDGGMTLARL